MDEASFLLSVALAAQPPGDEEPSAERARLLQRLAEGRAGTASDVVRRARSVGVDLSRASLWAVRARGSLAQLERLGVDALVDGDTALIAMRGDDDPWALARDLVRRGAAAVGIDSRGGEPWQVRDALAGAERACLVAAATGTPVRHGSELGALGGVARDVLAGERIEPAVLRGRGAPCRVAGRHRLVEVGGGPAHADLAAAPLRAAGCAGRDATGSIPTCRRRASSSRSRSGRCGWPSWRSADRGDLCSPHVADRLRLGGLAAERAARGARRAARRLGRAAGAAQRLEAGPSDEDRERWERFRLVCPSRIDLPADAERPDAERANELLDELGLGGAGRRAGGARADARPRRPARARADPVGP